jgi:hypothetical protein
MSPRAPLGRLPRWCGAGYAEQSRRPARSERTQRPHCTKTGPLRKDSATALHRAERIRWRPAGWSAPVLRPSGHVHRSPSGPAFPRARVQLWPLDQRIPAGSPRMDDVASVLQLRHGRDAPRTGHLAAPLDPRRTAECMGPMADRGGALRGGPVSPSCDEADRRLRAWRLRAGGHPWFPHRLCAGELEPGAGTGMVGDFSLPAMGDRAGVGRLPPVLGFHGRLRRPRCGGSGSGPPPSHQHQQPAHDHDL